MILEPGVLLRSGLLLTAFPGGITGPDSLGKPGHGLPKGWGSGKDPQVLPDSVPPGCLRLAGGGSGEPCWPFRSKPMLYSGR